MAGRFVAPDAAYERAAEDYDLWNRRCTVHARVIADMVAAGRRVPDDVLETYMAARQRAETCWERLSAAEAAMHERVKV